MYKIIFLFFFILLLANYLNESKLSFLSKKHMSLKENFNPNIHYNYDYPLSNCIIEPKCKNTDLLGNDNTWCYFGYYIPSILNYAFY